MRARLLSLALALLTTAYPSSEPQAQNKKGPADLLKLPVAKLEHASDAATGPQSLTALTDGDMASPVVFSTGPGGVLTLVIGFGGAVNTLEALEIAVGTGEQAATTVDLLVSQLSPHAGFSSLRTDPLKRGTGLAKLAFAPVGASYVMLKLTPPKGAERVSLTEVRLIGREGPPRTHYAFKESPAKALDVLSSLSGSGMLNVAITPDEASLFEDARDGKLDKWTFGEAALLASGVRSAADRKAYMERLEAIEADARRALANAVGSYGQGEALLRFLHSGPMSKGYSSHQTNVSTILDKGKFNCVSSAALYNIIGRRLGLDLRAVEVPDHAFSILYDGTSHADVETTTPGGFNPARNPAAQAEFQKLTGFAYIPDSNRDQRREVGELGLLAIIYYNHGVELTNAKRPQEALLAYFRAMSLDPEFKSAVKNALAVLANWSGDLSRGKRYEEAVRVASLGVTLAPQDAALLNNRRAVWSIWADALAKEGKTEEALAVLQRAEKEVPGGDFRRQQAWVFISKGEELVKAQDWKGALAIAGPAMARLDKAPREEVAEWVASVYGRWVQNQLKAGNFAGALGVIEERMRTRPDDRRATDNLAYVIQEQLKSVAAKDGAEAAERLIPEILKRFPGHRDVAEVTTAHFHRAIRGLEEAGRYEEALVLIARMEGTLGNAKLAAETKDSLHDRWALKIAREKRYEAALDVYEKAWPKLASKSNAENNVRYILQEWVKDVADRHGPAAPVEILRREGRRFAHVRNIDEIASGHVQRSVQRLVREKSYDKALDLVEQLKGLLKGEREAANTASFAYDAWAGELRKQGDWQGTVDVYAAALKKYPGNSHLESNAVAMWYQWSKPHMDKKEWSAAIAIYEKALERFPNHSLLKQNLAYCRAQLQKSQSVPPPK